MDLKTIFDTLKKNEPVYSIFIVLLFLLVGLLVHRIIFYAVKKWDLKSDHRFAEYALKHLNRLTLLALLVISLMLAIPLTSLPGQVLIVLRHFLSILIIINIGWLVIKFLYILRDWMLSQYSIDVQDNLKARKVYTQIGMIVRIGVIVTIVITVSCILMTFDKVQQLGFSILASAGVIGIIIGFAAQKSLGTIFAGIQLAVTQPIRIDDVVIVEGEWGRVEEINLTYVVIRIWDDRRLITPIEFFITKPFQNWTRSTSQLLGTVILYTDYTVPVENIRKELDRILEEHELWDQRVVGVQVTGTTEKTMQVRILISASNSSDAWTLRCDVREKMITFLQKNYPDALPKTRVELPGNHLSKSSKLSESS